MKIILFIIKKNVGLFYFKDRYLINWSCSTVILFLKDNIGYGLSVNLLIVNSPKGVNVVVS